jgi:hypothetical protein
MGLNNVLGYKEWKLNIDLSYNMYNKCMLHVIKVEVSVTSKIREFAYV